MGGTDTGADDGTDGRRLIFSAAFVIVFCTSGLSAFSVFVDPLMAATGSGRAEVAAALSLCQLTQVVFSIVSGRIVDRSGPRMLVYAGGVCSCLGWCLTAFAQSLTVLYLGFGLLIGAGVGLTYNPAISTCLRWFPDKRGSMAGLLLGASSLGTLVMAKLAAVLCLHFGSSGLFWIGLIYLCLTWAVGWKMRLPRPDWSPAGRGSEAAPERTPPGREYAPGAMMGTGVFWYLLLLYSLATTVGVMMISALSPMAQARLGLSPVAAADMVVVSFAANFFGRLATGRLCDKWGETRTLALIFALTGISLLGLGQAGSLWSFAVFLLVQGGAFGGVLVVFPPLTARLFGIAHSGANYGIVYFGYAVGALIGPQIAARASDPGLGVHAFSRVYLLGVGVAAVGLILSLAFIKISVKVGTSPFGGKNGLTRRRSR